MPRVMGIDIPGRKRIEYSLRYIHGIGPKRAEEIVHKAQIPVGKKADDLTAEEITAIAGVINEDYMVEGDLRRDVQANIRRLVSIGSYRGIRHRRGLPVRGQRTSTNARTRKGPRRAANAMRSARK